MKHLPIAILILALALPTALHAQDDFEDAPSKPKFTGIFGIGGGVDGIWHVMDMEPLNQALSTQGMPQFDADGMFLFGGHGYAYIMVIPNFRVGGIGVGGSIETSQTVDGQYTSSEFSTSFGGVTMEYVIPFNRFHIALGVLLGGGVNTLTLTKGGIGDVPWTDILNTPNTRAVMKNSFFTYQPTLTMEYDISPFFVASISGGYNGMSGSDWELNDEYSVSTVPDFKLENAFVRLQLTFGLFIGE